MCRDEVDILPYTLEHMATQVDHIIVADNISTDGSSELLRDYTRRLPLTVIEDPEVGYFQSRKMSALAELAADMGAKWVVPYDQDEVWYSPHGRVADVLADHPEAIIAQAGLYDHVATGADPVDLNPITRIGWRRQEPAPLPKVACRAVAPVRIHQGNHGADYGNTVYELLVVRHYPYRSVEQVVRKVRNGSAAYRATDLPEHMGAHWRQWGAILEQHGEEAIGDLFRRWFWRQDPSRSVVIEGERQPALIYDPAPVGAVA